MKGPDIDASLEDVVDVCVENDKNHKMKKKKRKISSEKSGLPEEVESKKLKPTTEDLGSEKRTEDNNGRKNKKALTGESLRASFKTSLVAGLGACRKFVGAVKNSNAETDLADEYLQAKGNTQEVLKILEKIDKGNLENVTTVFSAMQILIVKIMEKYPSYLPSAEESCRCLINMYLTNIHAMLSHQSNVKQRRVALKLLTSIVHLGGSLPRELLNHLSLHYQVVQTLAQPVNPGETNSVRTCFIDFLLAFLEQENVSLTKALLDKYGAVASVFPDLIYDFSDLACRVLVTVKKCILENPNIDKTTKLHVFNDRVVQNLVNLYNWKGPDSWAAHRSKKPSGVVNQDEKNAVVDSLHDFLLTLLTSKKYGIIFQDNNFGSSGALKNNNLLVNVVLQNLERAWEHEKPCDLIVRILTVCPSLIKPQLVSTEPYLSPKMTLKWLSAMQFVQKVIEVVDLENCIRNSQASPAQLSNDFLSLCVPLNIIKCAVIPSLENKYLFCRHQGIELAMVMLKKVLTFLQTAEKFHSVGDLAALKKVLVDYVLKNMPDLQIICKVWNDAFSMNEEEEVLEGVVISIKKDHLTSILELLSLYREVLPELSIVEGLDLTTLFTGLENVKENDMGKDDVTNLKIRAVQFLVSLDDNVLDVSLTVFEKALVLLILELSKNDLARSTLTTLLRIAFEGNDDERDIWIEAFSCYQTVDETNTIARWFCKTIQEAVRNTEQYTALVAQAEELEGEEIVGASKMKDIFEDLMEDERGTSTNTVSKLRPMSSISTVACCAIERLKKRPRALILGYVTHVFTDILHSQMSPRAFICLTRDIKELPIHTYLLAWSDETSSFLDAETLSYSVAKFLLSKEQVSIGEVIACFKNENVTLSKYQIVNYIRGALFCFTQFTLRGLLSKESNEKFIIVISRFLNQAKGDFSCLEECAKWIFRHPVLLQFFKPVCKKGRTMEEMVTSTLCKVSALLREESKGALPNSGDIFPYQAKLVASVKSTIERKLDGKKEKERNVSLLEKVFDAFNPSAGDAIHIITMIFELPETTDLVAKKEPLLSIWGVLVPKLLSICYGDKTLNNLLGHEFFLEKLLGAFVKLRALKVSDLGNWEERLVEYFDKFPGRIDDVKTETFNALFQHNISSTLVKLLSLLVSRSPIFASEFTRIAMTDKNILKQKDILFPIISRSTSFAWNNKFLSKVYSTYKDKISEYIVKPVKNVYWVKENVEAVIYLIKKTFEPDVCTKICESILQNGDKVAVINTQYIQLLEALFNKNHNDICSSLNFVHVLIHVMVGTLKKESNDVEKLKFLCETLSASIASLRAKDANFVFENLSKSNAWTQFTRFSLKLGLKVSKNKAPNRLLSILSKTCDVAYKDDCMEEYVKTIFEMASQHSEFTNIMLQGSTSTKRDLFELLWVLVRKNNSVMSQTHIPLYLAAYNATLGESDQFILMILQYYESHDIVFRKFQPYLFGEAARIHFSVGGKNSTSMWRTPSTSQVFDLFSLQLVNRTIQNFPLHRDLQCPKLYEASEVYDPAFYLPLFCSLLADSNAVAYYKVVQSGALALALTACSSTRTETRLAAYTVISKFHFHLNVRSSAKDKLLWTRFIDALRNGIASLDCPLKEVRLNGFVSTFLARASLIISEPLNPLYASLHAYLMAKSAMDVDTIPEFLPFLHSSLVEHVAHRHWILRVIRDGLKTKNDVRVAMKCFVFKILFSLYGSCMPNAETKRLVLQVVESASKIPMAGRLLANGHALLPWLNESAVTVDPRDRHSVDLIANIALNLSRAFAITKPRNAHLRLNEPSWHNMLPSVLLGLRPHLDTNLTLAVFTRYADVVREVIVNDGNCAALTIGVVELAKKLGIADAEKDAGDDDETKIARESFLRLARSWSSRTEH